MTHYFNLAVSPFLDSQMEVRILLYEQNSYTTLFFLPFIHPCSMSVFSSLCSLYPEKNNKRYYVCGMERKERCKFFKWADSEEGKIGNASSQIEDDQSDSSLRSEIWLLLNHGEPPLQMQLCQLMQIYFRSSKLSNSSVDSISESTCLVERDQPSLFKESLENKENTMEDFNDGVLNSIEKLGYLFHPLMKGSEILNGYHSQSNNLMEADEFVQASLDLLSLAVANSLTPSSKTTMPTWECWFAPLCEIISTCSSTQLQTQGKKC